MNDSISVYVVMRSPKCTFEVLAKTHDGDETVEYKSRVESNWEVVETGTENECKAYKTKGQIFKERFGYSRTMKNLLAKAGVGIEDYKRIRRERKKAQRKESDAKRDRARAGRKSKVSTVKK